MKCIKVYPILKHTFSESLTYWINEDVKVGEIIEAPLQNRKIWTVIDSIISINEAKEFIKSQNFTIRKIEHIKKLKLFSPEFVFSVLITANYFIKPFGEIFSELIPKKILENLTNDIEIDQDNNEIINIFPIKEYLNASKKIDNKILPIDIYKIDNENIKTINIYHSESEYYRHLFKKFDYRFFIEEFCHRKKIKLNKIETKLNLKNKNLYIIDQNSQNKATLKKKNLDGETYKDKLNIISPELFSALKKIEKDKESIFLYTLKKGFASKTICPDCKHIIRCPDCDEGLEIDLKNGKYLYRCINNHKGLDIETPCPICQNQNLLSLGASIEIIYKEIEKEFKIKIIKIDNDNHTKSEIKKELKDYIENKTPTIFIGNDFFLNQIISENIKFDNVSIISLESLFSIPLYDMEKDIYSKIALISNQTNKNLIIQTRDFSNIFWKNLKDNNLEEIKNKESLKKLKLPPYSTHIQISIPTEKSKKTLEIIKSYLDNNIKYYEIVNKTKTILHLLLDKEEYRQSSLVYYLKSLPSYVKIEVDSRNLL